MKNKYKTISLILLIIIILLIILISTSNIEKKNNNKVSELSSGHFNNISLEVYHFHGTDQCVSCKTVGDLAEKTLNTYFKEELKSGQIKFKHINAELPENLELAKKYGVTGSSLWIGTYLDGQFNKEENTRVWYKINNEEDYMSYLKGVLDKRLNGDLN